MSDIIPTTTPVQESSTPDMLAEDNLRDEPSTEHRTTLQAVANNSVLLKELQQENPTLSGVRQKLVSPRPDEALTDYFIVHGERDRQTKKRL